MCVKTIPTRQWWTQQEYNTTRRTATAAAILRAHVAVSFRNKLIIGLYYNKRHTEEYFDVSLWLR